MEVTVEVDIDDVLDSYSTEEVLDRYSREEIAEYLKAGKRRLNIWKSRTHRTGHG